MRVFICEKPSLAAAVAGYLGKAKKEDGYYSVNGDAVAWLYGHILSLDMPEAYDPSLKKYSYDTLPILPIMFNKHVKSGAPKNAFNTIKNLVKDADEVVNVGDPDREGQYLVDEVLEAIDNKKPAKRLLINAYDDASVKRAFEAMEDNSSSKRRNQYKAGYARDCADWLIGINASRKYSLDSGKPLRVGRVKVPTLALVERRNEEIANFTPVKYYVVRGFFRTADKPPFESLWQPKEDVEGLDSENRLIDVIVARKIVQQVEGQPGIVKKLEKKKGTKAPALPFSLSSLQQTCKTFTPDKVLSLAQSLYEKKLTSYPRSDANYIPDSQHADAATILANLKLTGDEELKTLADGADSSIKGKCFNAKKVDAHHAIIPTMQKVDLATLSKDEQILYKMIAKRYLLQFYPLQEFEDTICEIECAGETFVAKGKVIIKAGWTAAVKAEEDADSKDKDKDSDKLRELPELHEGDSLTLSVVDYLEKNTTPPKPFTQVSLIGAMCNAHKYVKDESLKAKLKDTKGIGTEATRSSILKELIEAGMLIETGKKAPKTLTVSDTVKELLKNLPDTLTYPDATALMEQDLDAIERGEITYNDFISRQVSYVKKLVQLESNFTKAAKPKTQTERVECPACHKGKLYYHDGKFGRFWSCSEWKSGCSAKFSDDNGKPAIYECPTCHKGYLIRYKSKKADNEYYWGCSTHECKTFWPDVNGKPFIKQCPECKKGYLTKRNGKNGAFWACNAYPDCKATFPYDNGRPGKKEAKK